jgi:glycogen(starch) synthase
VVCPSHFEPFSLVAAEALAAGIPVVASDQIGAAEGIDRRVCRVFAAGDLDALEAEVRRLLEQLAADGAAQQLAEQARGEARRQFGRREIGAELEEILSEATR